jgi:hypothetical protein
MRNRLAAATLMLLTAGASLLAACEKSNEAIVQEQFREAARQCDRGCAQPPPGCVIKGNVSDIGEKFYYLPSTPRYDDVIIQPERGEVWFCEVEDAVANGFTLKEF